MEEIEILTRRFHLRDETYKTIENDPEDFLKFVTQEHYWQSVFNLSTDNAKLRDFFGSLSQDDRDNYFSFGISCFMCFVQANFTGPEVPQAIDEFFEKDMFKSVNFAHRLSMNNEDINVNTKYPALLVISEIIFDCCIINNIVNLWWCCRALMIHQDVLDELSPTLHSNADRLHKLLKEARLTGSIKAEVDIELAQLYLRFRNISKSQDHIKSACDLLGLEYKMVGKLGKRTKHQENAVAQLDVSVHLMEKTDIERPEIDDLNIPGNVPLKDDVRLDQIQFSEYLKTIKLPNTEQKLIITIVQRTLIASPSDDLQVELILPFLDMLINQRSTYCVRFVALLTRSKLESKNKRTIERCLMQCEDLIKCYSKEEPHTLNRIGDVFGVALPPLWKVEALHANTLLNFGLVKDSLNIFLKIKQWEEVIVCYTLMQLRQKAAQIIKEQLEIKPTVKLLCLLGDATDDVFCYEKAWDLSKRRSHRAQRHWGQYFYNRKNYEECIPHFERSLSINPLQANIWLCLGHAALKVENWQTAATAYRRYTTLEPEGFEAWNNLAQAYIKIGNKRSAHQALVEALKCNYENWRVWENFLLVSGDIANFSDVIRAYHRVLDLKEKYLNVESLSLVVYSLCNDAKDAKMRPNAGNLLQSTRELLGRVTALFPSNGAVWELYASLAPTLILRAQRLQKAYRGYTQGNWDKSPKTCFHVLNICNKLAEIVLNDEVVPTDPLVSSIRLNISSAVSAIKKHEFEETKTVLDQVSAKLPKILEKIFQNVQ